MITEHEERRRYLVNRLYCLRGWLADYVGDEAGMGDIRIQLRRTEDLLREEYGSVPDAAELAAHAERLGAEAAEQARIARERHYNATGLTS
jgi:hypothetical protein